MKRYISFILVVAVLVCCLAVPSYASEYGTYFDVLSYSVANGLSNFSGVSVGTNSFTFDLPQMLIPYGFDILIKTNVTPSRAAIAFGSSDYQLNIISVGNGLYRLSGDFVYYNLDSLELLLNFSSNGVIEFLSFKVFTLPDSVFDLPLDAVVSYGDGEEKYFSYPPTSDSYGVTFPGSDSYLYDEYSAYLYIDDYFKFDFLNIQVYLSQANFTSISASCGSVNIPISYSLINSDSSLSRFVVNLSIDCDSLRGLTDTLEIIFEGNTSGISSSVCYFGVLYSSGYVESSLPNEDLYFFNQMKTFLSGMFNNIGSWFTNLGQSIGNDFLTLKTDLLSKLSSVESTIAAWGNNIIIWSEFISNRVDHWGSSILAVLSPDSSDADSVIDKADQQAGELETGNDVLNNVAKPDLSQTGDITSIVPTNATVQHTVFLNHLMTAPIISDVVMLSIIFALAGFVLFGKR